MKRAEQVQFVSDENGWELHVTDEDGFVTRFNIHDVAWNLPDQADATIGAWRREGLAAVGLQASAGDDLTDEDRDAYPLGDLGALTRSEADLDSLRDRMEGW
jgi:hypothetical protein